MRGGMSRPVPHFVPFRGVVPSCPLCSTRFVDREPVCDCVDREEDWRDECPCCRDRWDQIALDRDYEQEWRDYDAEEHEEEHRVWAYSEWCVPGWDARERWREHGEDYDAWRRAFPALAWGDDGSFEIPPPGISELPPAPWERWETAAERAATRGRRTLRQAGWAA